MATPLKNMELAFWNYLNAQAAYTALGLKEFRTYDGNLLPWDPGNPDAMWPVSDLPAIVLQLDGWGKTTRVLRNPPDDEQTDPVLDLGGHALQSTCNGSIVYPGPTRDACEAAVMVVRSIIDTRAAHVAQLGDSSAIEEFVLAWGDFNPWRGRQRGVVLFWEQQFVFTPQVRQAVVGI